MRSLIRQLTIFVTASCALLLASPAAGQTFGPATAAGNLECTAGPVFDLTATDGRIQTPDGNSLYMWGYDGGNGFQIPGPVLCVTEGDVVTVNLTNALDEPTSLVFPGQSGVTATGGGPGLLAREAGMGETVSYSFTAGRPGTYLYESGTEPSKQVELGLYGALIVRPAIDPAGCGAPADAAFAYNDCSTRFDPAREYLILLHDIDPDLHHAADRGRPFDITTKHDHYWTINGRSFPDTIADSHVPWLPNQPYGSLVWVEMDGELPALIRYANAGLANHPFHPHGNHLSVIARDGALLKNGGTNAAMEAFSKTIGSGQTYDLLFRYDDDEGYSVGTPVTFSGSEVVFPGLLNSVFKDDLTFYSGSPYLGQTDELPSPVTTFNECGEFYYPWHSHALNEFQNFNEGFGGLATLLRVDPPGGCRPPAEEGPIATAAPALSGPAVLGETLTATNGKWIGFPPIDFTRQWERLVGSDWVAIPGAMDSSYALTGDDVGTQVRIVVTAVNEDGSATAQSDPSGVVAATLASSARTKPVAVSASSRLSGRTLTIRARTARCAPCQVTARVKAGADWRTLKMRKFGRRYVAVAGGLARGPVSSYAIARDLDSRRTARSALSQARIGPAAAVTINLCADEGTAVLTGSVSVPIWGFSQDGVGGCDAAQLPGPTLVVQEDDVVTVNLTNNLDSESVSLVFPGQTLAPDVVGAAPGETTSYTFTAANPGVYLYESGVNTQIQLPMGLYGALVVRPALGANYAYNDVSTRFDQEQVMVLSEVDTDLNNDPGSFDLLDWDPDYWLINGKAYPDIPDITAPGNARVALRYLNAGQEHHTMTLVGTRQQILARDSFFPQAVSPDIIAETIATGSTADAIAVVPADPGARLPLYSRQLAVTNDASYPGGMLRFIAVSGP